MNRYYSAAADVDRWQKQRQQCITATDSAAILGLHPYQTPLGVYLSKIDELPPGKESPAMRWGLLAEPVVSRMYELETGRLLTPEPFCQRHLLGASADRVCLGDERIVELKTAGLHMLESGQWGDEGTDEVPGHYLIQVQHQMYVLGYEVADIAVLFGTDTFRIYTVHADKGIQSALVEAATAFWKNHVEARVSPPVDWRHASTAELVQRMNRPRAGLAIEIEDAEADRLAATYELLGQEIKRLEDERETTKAKIVQLLGEAERVRTGAGRTITRKVLRRAGYVVEPAEYVSFRIQKQKEKING